MKHVLSLPAVKLSESKWSQEVFNTQIRIFVTNS